MSVAVAIIAVVASVLAAVVAGLFALAARRYEGRLQHASEARDRISEQKRLMYEPMVNLLDHMFSSDEVPSAEELRHKRHFDTWVNIYGSDGVVRAYSRFLQALPLGPPPDIQLRLYADFLIEVRKDMGDPHSGVDRLELLGGRLANLSDRSSFTDPSIDSVCKRLGWTPPW